jgi:hypothetical protein
VAVTITAIGAVFAKVYPSRADYLIVPGWLSVYALCGGVHGDGTLLAVMNHPFLLYSLIGLCNTFIYAGLMFVAVRIWKNFHSA